MVYGVCSGVWEQRKSGEVPSLSSDDDNNIVVPTNSSVNGMYDYICFIVCLLFI